MEQATIFDAITQAEAARAARAARDEGMQRAVDHADRVEPGWQVQADAAVRQYASTHDTLTCELVRRYAEAGGMSKPPDGRAWGGAMVRAAKAGVIAKAGYVTATDPKVHMNPVTLWKSLIR